MKNNKIRISKRSNRSVKDKNQKSKTNSNHKNKTT